ncbi:hypothetical protein VUR80DRAFT_4822 [Thermomyces stellatus]
MATGQKILQGLLPRRVHRVTSLQARILSPQSRQSSCQLFRLLRQYATLRLLPHTDPKLLLPQSTSDHAFRVSIGCLTLALTPNPTLLPMNKPRLHRHERSLHSNHLFSPISQCSTQCMVSSMPQSLQPSTTPSLLTQEGTNDKTKRERGEKRKSTEKVPNKENFMR